MWVAAGVCVFDCGGYYLWVFIEGLAWRPTPIWVWMSLLAIASAILAAVARIRLGTLSRIGCCPNCGYTREGLPPNAVCPECGHAAG
jgi:hypothetical protein